MNAGKQFERDWQDSYKGTGFFYMRLKDAPKWVRGQGATFTPSNPCDAIQFSPPFLWLLELKSTGGTSISFNKGKPWEKSNRTVMIAPSQVRELMSASKHFGVIAGLVLNFRERRTKTSHRENCAYFIHIADFIKWAEANPNKGSINIADCEAIGVQIECTKKRVRYHYHIAEFADLVIAKLVNSGTIDKEKTIDTYTWLRVVAQGMEGQQLDSASGQEGKDNHLQQRDQRSHAAGGEI